MKISEGCFWELRRVGNSGVIVGLDSVFPFGRNWKSDPLKCTTLNPKLILMTVWRQVATTRGGDYYPFS